MVDNVFNFPNKADLPWLGYVAAIRDGLSGWGCTQAEIAHVCEAIQPIYQRMSQGKNFVVKDAEGFAEVQRWVHEQVNGLMGELALREVKIYRLMND